MGGEVVGELVARPELQPEGVLQTLQLAIEAVLIDARQGGEHRGELLAHSRGDELRQSGVGEQARQCLRRSGDGRYLPLEDGEALAEARLTAATEDADYGREGPVALLVGSHEGGEDGGGSLALEALGLLPAVVGEGSEGRLDVALLEHGLAVEAEAPAVGREDQPCGVIVGSVDSSGGIAR